VPFLKFSRDKRGYEHFSLVEPIPGRHGKSRPRILFWFRTPPQVKVGREPFPDEVRRAIETQNPGVRFDWARLMATPIPAPDAEQWRERRRAERVARQAARESDEAEADTPGESSVEEGVRADEARAAVPADATVSTSESKEHAPTAAPASGVERPAGGRRRRRRRGRRKPHPQTETASAPVAPNVPGLPTDEV
jgi:hypothetical protein